MTIELTMEITEARREKNIEFATKNQRDSFLKSGSNFLILGCDASIFDPDIRDEGNHAVYVKDYEWKTRTFVCINSWGGGEEGEEEEEEENPYPKIQDDVDAKVFNVWGVHLQHSSDSGDSSDSSDCEEDFTATTLHTTLSGKQKGKNKHTGSSHELIILAVRRIC